LQLNPDAINYERETYNILDWLGDIGGLFDALRIIFGLLVAPVASYALRVSLVSTIFTRATATSPGKQKPAPHSLPTCQPDTTWRFPVQAKIKSRGVCWNFANWSKSSRYHRMLKDAEQAMSQ